MQLSEFTIQFWERRGCLIDIKREDVIKSQFNFNLVPVNCAIFELEFAYQTRDQFHFKFLPAHQLI